MPPAQPFGSPVAQSSGNNGLAIAALVVGIASILLSFFCVGLVAGPIAILLGFLGRKKAKELGGNGNGLALAGIITGALGFVISVVFVLFAVVFNNAVDDLDGTYNSDPVDGECNYDRIWEDPDC